MSGIFFFIVASCEPLKRNRYNNFPVMLKYSQIFSNYLAILFYWLFQKSKLCSIFHNFTLHWNCWKRYAMPWRISFSFYLRQNATPKFKSLLTHKIKSSEQKLYFPFFAFCSHCGSAPAPKGESSTLHYLSHQLSDVGIRLDSMNFYRKSSIYAVYILKINLLPHVYLFYR